MMTKQISKLECGDCVNLEIEGKTAVEEVERVQSTIIPDMLDVIFKSGNWTAAHALSAVEIVNER